eukprot:scaffold545_cov372-Pavlova_lutheri.AAC.14
MEPSHEEDPQGESVRDQAQARVVGEPSRVDVSHQVIFEDGDAVVDVGTGFAVRESIEEPSEPYPFGFFVSFPVFVLEVPEVLFPQLHFFLRSTHHTFRQHASYAVDGLSRPAIRRVVEEQPGSDRHDLCDVPACFPRLCSSTQGERHAVIRHFGIGAVVDVALGFRVSQQDNPGREHLGIARHGRRRGGMVPGVVQAASTSIERRATSRDLLRMRRHAHVPHWRTRATPFHRPRTTPVSLSPNPNRKGKKNGEEKGDPQPQSKGKKNGEEKGDPQPQSKGKEKNGEEMGDPQPQSKGKKERGGNGRSPTYRKGKEGKGRFRRLRGKGRRINGGGMATTSLHAKAGKRFA